MRSEGFAAGRPAAGPSCAFPQAPASFISYLRSARQERSLCRRTSRSSWRDRGQDGDVPWGLEPMPRRSRCSRGRASSDRSRVSLPRPTTRAVPLLHQRPALAAHRVLAKGERRDACAILGPALTEEVERLAIAGGPVQSSDTVVHLSRHHAAIHDRLRIHPLRHEEDFARTGQIYKRMITVQRLPEGLCVTSAQAIRIPAADHYERDEDRKNHRDEAARDPKRDSHEPSCWPAPAGDEDGKKGGKRERGEKNDVPDPQRDAEFTYHLVPYQGKGYRDQRNDEQGEHDGHFGHRLSRAILAYNEIEGKEDKEDHDGANEDRFAAGHVHVVRLSRSLNK